LLILAVYSVGRSPQLLLLPKDAMKPRLRQWRGSPGKRLLALLSSDIAIICLAKAIANFSLRNIWMTKTPGLPGSAGF
jgi:hypothetical protein